MLDLAKLAGQIPGISNHLRLEAVASRQRLERAEQLLAKAKTQQESLVKSHQEWRDRMIFTAATPVESLDTCVDISSPPESHSVFATDGSQISPS
ncbi:MAG: nuclease, partial [Moorea sp. SIO4G2]|nr:nuclease [Moorena sp. SIO4G2]